MTLESETETAEPKNQYSYLADLANDEVEEGIILPMDFANVIYAHPNSPSVGGVMADKNKFCAEGFPKQNIDQFYMITLFVNPQKRLMYWNEYSGQAVPPDCQSHDGIHPTAPMTLNGKQITKCVECPLYGFGKNYKCHTKPTLLALAYYPEMDHMVIPIRKDMPGLSSKSFTSFCQTLNQPTLVGGEYKKIPFWARVTRVFAQMTPNAKYGGNTPTWGFEVLNEDSKYPGVPNFVPPDLVAEIQKMVGLAKYYSQAQAQTAQIGASPAPAQLTGGQGAVHMGVDPGATDPMVVQAEEKSFF